MAAGAKFDWDTNNAATSHGTVSTPEEVEQVFANRPVYLETRIDARSGERRVLELGHTDTGRVLFVAWTFRGDLTRPVTAFDADRKVRAAYNETRKRDEEEKHEH